MIKYSQWASLPINIRHKLAGDFNIQKKFPTHVQDNKIVSDGYDILEVEKALTVENMQTYLGVGKQETNVDTLWNMILEQETHPPHEANVVTNEPVIIIPKKHRGRVKGSKNKSHANKTTTL